MCEIQQSIVSSLSKKHEILRSGAKKCTVSAKKKVDFQKSSRVAYELAYRSSGLALSWICLVCVLHLHARLIISIPRMNIAPPSSTSLVEGQYWTMVPPISFESIVTTPKSANSA